MQAYLKNKEYPLVSVYASNGKARNNIGNWSIQKVDVDKKIKGFQFYSQKDLQMAIEVNYGFMIWNGKSKGTLNNIVNLLRQEKTALVYLVDRKEFITVDSFEKAEELVKGLDKKTEKLFYKLVEEIELSKADSNQLTIETVYN